MKTLSAVKSLIKKCCEFKTRISRVLFIFFILFPVLGGMYQYTTNPRLPYNLMSLLPPHKLVFYMGDPQIITPYFLDIETQSHSLLISCKWYKKIEKEGKDVLYFDYKQVTLCYKAVEHKDMESSFKKFKRTVDKLWFNYYRDWTQQILIGVFQGLLVWFMLFVTVFLYRWVIKGGK